jgi:hypothetical protein
MLDKDFYLVSVITSSRHALPQKIRKPNNQNVFGSKWLKQDMR